jgi:hypothetical protein
MNSVANCRTLPRNPWRGSDVMFRIETTGINLDRMGE